MWNTINRLSKKLALIVIVAVLIFCASPALGQEEAVSHENPETAELAFNGISLLRYYSNSLDSVLRKDAEETETKLQKMPFVNLPECLTEATDNFATDGIDVSHLVVDIDENLDTLRKLLAQSRLEECTEVANEIADKLTQAYEDLDGIEDATEVTGGEFRATASAGGDLRRSYDEVVDRIDRIREMLDLYKSLMADALLGIQALELQLAEGLLKPTELTLKVEPMTAFVGDNIYFEGILTSKGEPLVGREVYILLDGSQHTASMTGTDGRYQGTLQLPYWYIHQVEVQALYYPRDEDIGVYISSLSPEIELEVLFYEAELELTVEDEAYPGWETTIGGKFDYGQPLPPRERKVEFYLDTSFLAETMVPETFEQKISMPPEAELGYHAITVSAEPMERYAPVTASAYLKVTRAIPIVDMNLPRVALIPGSIALSGRIYSELGPVSQAPIKMSLGKSQINLVSSEDGTFDTKIKVGMTPSPIGSQDIRIQVIPREPWHAMFSTSRRMMVVNIASSGGILAMLLGFGVLARGRLRRRRKVVLERMPAHGAIAQPVQAYSDSMVTASLANEKTKSIQEPRSRILNLYRWIIMLIQTVTSALFKPQQTLREFFRENRTSLGPTAKFFEQLTRMVERLLYSNYQPTEEDDLKSEQLSHNIEEEIKR